VDEETLVKAFLMAWNALVEKREDFMEHWKEQMQSENLLEKLTGGDVYGIHRWGRAFDGNGYGLHAENAGPHQGI